MGQSSRIVIGAGMRSNESDRCSSGREITPQSLIGESFALLTVVAIGDYSKISCKEGGKSGRIYSLESVDCKSGGVKPDGKVTSSSIKSRVVTSTYVTPIGSEESVAASVDKSSGGSRQI